MSRKNGSTRALLQCLNALEVEKIEHKEIDNDFQLPHKRKKGWKGHRSVVSMPIEEKKWSKGELIQCLNVLIVGKLEFEGIDNNSRCPRRSKKTKKGNR